MLSDSPVIRKTYVFMEDTLNGLADPVYNGTVEFGSHDGRGFEHVRTSTRCPAGGRFQPALPPAQTPPAGGTDLSPRRQNRCRWDVLPRELAR